ncbi:LptA/OstA family protein [Parvularcula lutaonensis]|uniref:LptA/OstA family protein n=1 Tax=Parvularcula lutaonensis TaxID=491923 RepID=A0ABV7MBU9_9PROT|nr:LptA/OstA family protein [Parvularcula lutaonensis]GGY45337.1 hypothetical protein GCM10007148_12880 [Parvularcula lutaonensis]
MLIRALIIAGLLFTAAEAQTVSFDPNKPTEVDGDRAELLGGGEHVILEGNVSISQPGVILTADRMDVFRDADGDLQRVEAAGRVRYAAVTGDAIAGDRAIYFATENRLVVQGNVVVLQQGQVATAEELTYNTETGAMVMTGGDGRRVRGLLQQQGES